MINVYLIDKNRIFTGELIVQNEKSKIVGIITEPINYNSETECLLWDGFKWIIKPIAFKQELELVEFKEVAKSELDKKFKAQIDAGFTYNDWTFDLSDDKEDKIAKQQTMINNETVQILLNPDYVRKMTYGLSTDRTNVQRQIDWSEWNDFFVSYSMRLFVLKGTYASLRNQIEEAENETELNDINIVFPSEE